ncbi:hypothetical protein ZWY2020_026180 [Hordeum vulgare]|nr:hypothetical protein ZWY2020_026180 [Hordeum vulgare]
MAPLQNIAVALTLLIVMVEIESLPMLASATIVKSEEAALDELTPIIKTALDGVLAAAPPSERIKVAGAVAKQELLAMDTMKKAKGDKAKFDTHLLAYKIAAKIVTAAAPAEKFKKMEDSFTEASRPIPCKPMDAEDCEDYTDVFFIKFAQVSDARLIPRPDVQLQPHPSHRPKFR